jgi:hypothetical protein
MNRQTSHLIFASVWEDADLQELVVSARSSHFSGETSLYVVPSELISLADHLAGFPHSRDDRREFALGQPDLSSYGEIRGTLYCRDSLGHIGVHLEIRCTPAEPSDRPESCSVLLQVVPSDIDRFVAELRGLKEGLSASLANAT